MKTLFAILLILPVAIAADPPSTKTPFTLKAGESKIVQGLNVTVGFTNVPTDSRCPSSVVCIWEGDAAVFMWLQEPGEERVEFNVHTSMHFGPSRVVNGYSVFLVDVVPYPVYGGDIDPADYVATIDVTRAPTVPTEAATWGRVKALYN